MKTQSLYKAEGLSGELRGFGLLLAHCHAALFCAVHVHNILGQALLKLMKVVEVK